MNVETILNAVEAELRNARAALNSASNYLDVLRTVMETVVVSERGETFFPIETDTEDETIVYGLKVKAVNMKLDGAQLPI